MRHGRAGGWGALLGAGEAFPAWLWALVCIVALDAAIWTQHRLFHAVPLLWRLHRMHHADLDIDVTTGLRFHPLELALSMLVKVSVVLLLGAPPVAVLAFEVLLNATSLFSHSNVALPPRVDAMLRWFVVTPDMHRVHHSWDVRETDRNFGFNLSCWDRLIGTYQAQPRLGHQGMTIGLPQFRDPRELRLDRMLLQPFRETIARRPERYCPRRELVANRTASSAALHRAPALFTHSRCSYSGTLSATMPAPAWTCICPSFTMAVRSTMQVSISPPRRNSRRRPRRGRACRVPVRR